MDIPYLLLNKEQFPLKTSQTVTPQPKDKKNNIKTDKKGRDVPKCHHWHRNAQLGGNTIMKHLPLE